MNEIVRKINDTKFSRVLKMNKLIYNNIINEDEILEDLKICKKTLKKWKEKMNILQKIEKITIDRALNEMIFKDKNQIACFNYLKEDCNWFAPLSEIQKVVPISRYYYKAVKEYMMEEIQKI